VVVAFAIVVVAALVMEPVTYAVHRWVMHGPGLGWHRSHHRRRTLVEDSGRFERNDLYPVVFGALTVTGLAIGFNADALAGLVPVLVGVSVYGVAYLVVHDLYIHRRIDRLRWRHPALDRLADAHALHHRYGGEPYGMLAPLVPRSVRDRASGSTPSQVPAEW
jgi:beta-carotene 3-hydroxylase